MRLNRFYTERKNIRIGSSVKLEDSDINHIRKVLRLGKGDEIILFNGEKEFLAVLKLVSSEVVLASVKEVVKEQSYEEATYNITLYQGLLRAGKFDLIIEKCTEIGVSRIVPTEFDHSQTKVENVEHKGPRWNNLAIAASKQSNRISPLTVSPAINFRSFTQEEFKNYDLVLFFTTKNPESKLSLSELVKGKANIAIIVGPEGGFSAAEENKADDLGLKKIMIDKYNVLRSETASIVLSALVKYLQ